MAQLKGLKANRAVRTVHGCFLLFSCVYVNAELPSPHHYLHTVMQFAFNGRINMRI